jgi:hypothetical protein
MIVAQLTRAYQYIQYRKNWWRLTGPTAFFGFLTTFFTYPTIFNFTTAVSGVAVEDRLQNLWNFWWVRQALTHGQNPYLTDKLFFPYYQSPNQPLPLYFHDLQFFNGLVTLPLQLIGGVAAAYNGVVLGATLVSALATYGLIRKLGGSVPASLVGGAIYAFAPTRLSTIAQSITNIQSTEFLPLYALFLHLIRSDTRLHSLSSLARYKKSALIGAILTLTACIYTDWYNTIYLLAYSLFYLVWQLGAKPHTLPRLRSEFTLMLAVMGSTFILVAPLLLPSLANLANPAFRTTPGYDREVKSSATLAALLWPGAFPPNWSSCLVGYIGLGLTLIATLFLFRGVLPSTNSRLTSNWLCRPVYLYWSVLATGALVMALGPELRINENTNTGLPLPYALFRLLPLVSITRNPSRFIILAMLGIAVLSAFALDWLGTATYLNRPFNRMNPQRRWRLVRSLLAGLTVSLLIMESWTPLPLFEVKSNPFLEKLATEPGHSYLLELPITRHYNHDQVRMFNQIAHGQPIVGGYLSRPVVDPYRFPNSAFAPIADLVLRGKRQPQDIIKSNTNEEDLDDLVALYDFSYIVLYLKEFSDPDQLSGITNLIESHYGAGQIVYRDEELKIYRVPVNYLSQRPRDINLALGEGWYGVEREDKTYWRWARARAVVYTTSVTNEKAQLKLRLRPFAQFRTLQVQLNQKTVFQTSVPTGSPTEYSFELDLLAGRNELSLINLEGEQSPNEISVDTTDARKLSFAVNWIQVICLECSK